MNIGLANFNYKGSVLLYTFIILILMGLLGAAIIGNTQTEISISHQTYVGRDAFTKADSTARLSTFFARSLFSGRAGNYADCINSTALLPEWAPSIRIEFNPDFKVDTVNQTHGLLLKSDILNRYLAATGASGTTPDIVIYSNDQVIGRAALTVALPPLPKNAGTSSGSLGVESFYVGGSVDENRYDNAGDNRAKVYLMVTASGSIPLANGDVNYFTGDPKTTHSIVTTIFREFVQ